MTRRDVAATDARWLRGPNVAASALRAMDNWLSAIAKDTRSHASQTDKVAANKPADLTDAWYTAGGAHIAEPGDLNNNGQCGALYPYSGNPRMVTGAPLVDDVLKCQLKAMQRSGLSRHQ